MHPSAQRWSDMAKQPNTGLADDLNAEGSAKDGLSVDDLNAGDNTQVKQPLSKQMMPNRLLMTMVVTKNPKTLNRRSMWC